MKAGAVQGARCDLAKKAKDAAALIGLQQWCYEEPLLPVFGIILPANDPFQEIFAQKVFVF